MRDRSANPLHFSQSFASASPFAICQHLYRRSPRVPAASLVFWRRYLAMVPINTACSKPGRRCKAVILPILVPPALGQSPGGRWSCLIVVRSVRHRNRDGLSVAIAVPRPTGVPHCAPLVPPFPPRVVVGQDGRRSNYRDHNAHVVAPSGTC